METAVILAAGMGIRIRKYLGEIPKGMIKIDDQSILQRSINLLLEKDINKIYIVTGYQSDILKKHIGVYKGVCQKEEEKEVQRQNL